MSAIIVACGSALIAAITSILTLLLNHKWQKEEKSSGLLAEIRSVKSSLQNHIDEQEKGEALMARRRIIEFSDECRRGVRHSEEHWENVLDDTTFYKNYCEAHKGFENSKCKLSTELIEDLYKRVKVENDFI